MPTAFRLAAYLLLAQLAGFALLLLFWPNWPLALGLALGLTLALLWPVLRTVQQVEEALAHLPNDHPSAPLPARWHGPLGQLVRALNVWLTHAQATAALREGLLDQTRESAAQQERNRLARELHDSIKQQLFTINISAAAAQARLAQNPASAAPALADVRDAAQEALAEMTALLQQLAPAPLEKVGLHQALRDQGEALAYRTGATVQTDLREIPADALTPALAEGLFRLAQEALSNIARHARAQKVQVTLQLVNDDLILEIADDGQGFEVNTGSGSGGMGLANLRQRTAALGGRLALRSTLGRGTTLTVHLPRAKPIVPLLMFTPNHTFNKTILLGLAGGLGLLLALYYPLYVLWPRQFVGDWPAPVAFDGWSLLLQILAAALLVGTGYGAARWANPHARAEAITLGAVAGLCASALAYLGLGNAAASLPAQALLLAHPLFPITDSELSTLLTDSILGVMGWIPVAFWAATFLGAGLGALGGSLAPVAPAPAPATRIPLRLAALTALSSVAFCSGLSVFITFVLFSSLEPSLARTALENQLPPPEVALNFFLFFLNPIALYGGSIGLAYLLLRAEGQLPLTDALSRARRLVMPQRAALAALALAVWPLVLLWLNFNGWQPGPGTQMALWLTVGVSWGLSGLYAHLALTTRRTLQAVEPTLPAWDWLPDVMSALVLAGLFPTLAALSRAMSFPRADTLAWAALFSLLEGTWVVYLVRHFRRQTPTLPHTLTIPLGFTSLLSSMFGVLFSFGLLLTPIHAVVGLAVVAINPLVNHQLNNTWPPIVAAHYLLGGQILLAALLIIAASMGLVMLVIWVVGKKQ